MAVKQGYVHRSGGRQRRVRCFALVRHYGTPHPALALTRLKLLSSMFAAEHDSAAAPHRTTITSY